MPPKDYVFKYENYGSIMDFGENIYYCGNSYNGEPRKEEFLAYLYAE